MNSRALEERHREVYEELYRTCPTVVSVPGTLRWSPSYAVGPGGIGLHSKLPLRLHVGIEPQTSGGCSLGTIRYYVPEQDAFVVLDLTRAIVKLELLEAVAKRHGKPMHGRLYVVSEIPNFRGLNVDAAYGVATAAAWLVHLGVVTPDTVAQFTRAPAASLSAAPTFVEFWRLALQIESSIAMWVADGDCAAATILDSAYPIAYFRERDPILFDHYRDHGTDDPSSYYNVPANLFFRIARMEEMFTLDPLLYWPIDIALLSTGEEGSSTAVFRTRIAMKVQLDEVAAFIRAHCAPTVPEMFRHVPEFLELATDTPQQSSGMAMYRTYRQTSVVQSMVVLKAMHDLIQYGATSSALNAFLGAQDACQTHLSLLGLSSSTVARARNVLRLSGGRQHEHGVAARLIGPGLHGYLMVLAPLNVLEEVLTAAMPRIAEEIGRPVHCHYASWRDGTPPADGVRVTQHLATGRRSPYVVGAALTIHAFDGAVPVGTLLATPDRWERERTAYDLVLDQHANRITVRGNALDSSELHSAKQTIELLKHVLKERKREFPAAELPASPYRDDRNQMESKVIRPLKVAVERYTGKPFDCRVTGGLGRNYTLIFAPNGHRIAWVERG